MKALEEFFLRSYPIVVNKLTFELNPSFTYHNVHHTLDVMNVAESIGTSLKLPPTDIHILKIAALFHDTGYLFLRKGHEERSIGFFLECAQNSLLDQNIISKVSTCINATKMPQQPTCLLDEILCDADLDYLGRDDFDEIEMQLFLELESAGEIKGRVSWDHVQVSFLENHKYHTQHSIDLRTPKLQEHLLKIKNRLI